MRINRNIHRIKTTKMKILNPLISIICCLTLVAMVQTDENERVRDCALQSGEDAIYLREFIVSLPRAEAGERPPMYRQAVILRAKNIYRFNLCNDLGQAIIRIYDTSDLLISSYDPGTDQEFNPINFSCRKTGQYNIIITFKDGEAGEAIGIMSHVMK